MIFVQNICIKNIEVCAIIRWICPGRIQQTNRSNGIQVQRTRISHCHCVDENLRTGGIPSDYIESKLKNTFTNKNKIS